MFKDFFSKFFLPEVNFDMGLAERFFDEEAIPLPFHGETPSSHMRRCAHSYLRLTSELRLNQPIPTPSLSEFFFALFGCVPLTFLTILYWLSAIVYYIPSRFGFANPLLGDLDDSDIRFFIFLFPFCFPLVPFVLFYFRFSEAKHRWSKLHRNFDYIEKTCERVLADAENPPNPERIKDMTYLSLVYFDCAEKLCKNLPISLSKYKRRISLSAFAFDSLLSSFYDPKDVTFEDFKPITFEQLPRDDDSPYSKDVFWWYQNSIRDKTDFFLSPPPNMEKYFKYGLDGMKETHDFDFGYSTICEMLKNFPERYRLALLIYGRHDRAVSFLTQKAKSFIREISIGYLHTDEERQGMENIVRSWPWDSTLKESFDQIFNDIDSDDYCGQEKHRVLGVFLRLHHERQRDIFALEAATAGPRERRRI